MKKVKEVKIEIPKNELRCFFCYCKIENEIVNTLNDSNFYHYICILEKFKVNEVKEFKLRTLDGKIKDIKVKPDNKKSINTTVYLD